MLVNPMANRVATALVVAGLLVLVLSFGQGVRTRTETSASQAFAERFDALKAGDDLSAAWHRDLPARALILVFDSKCPFCNASMSFYRKLRKQLQRDAVLKLVAVSVEPASISGPHLASHGLDVDNLITISADLLKIRGTPTLLLVINGRIQRLWVGKLTGGAEVELLNEVSHLSNN